MQLIVASYDCLDLIFLSFHNCLLSHPEHILSLIWGKAVSGVYIELKNIIPLLKQFAVLLLFTMIIGCGGIMTFV